jgi:hypothetical protein
MESIMSRYKELVEIFFADNYRYRINIANTDDECMKCGNELKMNIDPAKKLENGMSVFCPDCIKILDITTTEEPRTVC